MTIFGYGSVIFDKIIYRDFFLPEKQLETPGGSVANVLRALAIMGLRTSILTVVGEDDYGKRTLADLDEWGVEREFTHTIGGRCSRSLIFEVTGGKFRPSHDDQRKLSNSSNVPGETTPHATLREYALLPAERETILTTGEWFHFDAATKMSIELAREARERGKCVSYDCGRPTYRRQDMISELLCHCNVLKINCPLVRELVREAGPEELLVKWPNLQYVFVTDGEAGAEVLWHDRKGLAHKIKRKAQTLTTLFVDPLGAGDAFMAGVIERFQAAAQHAGVCIEQAELAHQALERGIAQGAKACCQPGAMGYLKKPKEAG